jgi:hypothetical protein
MGGRNGGRAKGSRNSKRIEYSDEVALAVCEGIASGETLRAVCKRPDLPTESTVRHWVVKDVNGFAAKYQRAREMQADMIADQILTIADEASGDKDAIAKARLQIDARRWLAGVLLPRKYGQRIAAELTGANGGPIKTEQQFPELKDMSDEDLLALRDILMRRAVAEEEGNAAGGRSPTQH